MNRLLVAGLQPQRTFILSLRTDWRCQFDRLFSLTMMISAPNFQTPATDPTIGSTLEWVTGILLGQLGTSIAIVGIGFLGYSILLGNLDLRNAARTLFGCFILFGAPTIVKELIALVGYDAERPSVASENTQQILPAPSYTTPAANPFDPYSQ